MDRPRYRTRSGGGSARLERLSFDPIASGPDLSSTESDPCAVRNSLAALSVTGSPCLSSTLFDHRVIRVVALLRKTAS
jgi:hypothetical protein